MVVATLGALRGLPQLVASAKRSVLTVAFLLILASVALIASFLTHDFGVSYVAQHSNQAMPWYYTASAFYGGQEGSLLYWALMLSIFSAIFVFTAKRAPAVLVPYVIATLMGIETFLLIVLTTVSSRFVRLPVPLADGVGLNLLLMDPDMGTCVGSMVGLPCPGMGWVLGLGPGRECSAAPMVNRNSIPAFSDGARTQGHAQSLESKPGDRLLCPLHIWHF